MWLDPDFLVFKSTNPSFTIAELKVGFSKTATYYGKCLDGYICLEGSIKPAPSVVSEGYGYPCPIGHYCPTGVVIEIPCPPGYYQDTVQ